MREVLLALMVTIAGCGMAHADPLKFYKAGGDDTYFNRPGANMAVHDAELRECMGIASGSEQPGVVGGGGLVGSLLLSMTSAEAVNANIESCMVVRGWRVVKVAPDERASLAALDQPALAARLANWVGADTTHGDIVRQWANNALSSATYKFERAPLFGSPSLSLKALEPLKPPAAGSSSQRSSAWNSPSPKFAKGLSPSAVAGTPANAAVVIIRLQGTALSSGQMLWLRRAGQNPTTLASVEDGLPDEVRAMASFVLSHDGKTLAFAVPPGRWFVDMIGATEDYTLGFCLGAPSFEIKAGETVFAGVWDLSNYAGAPGLSLDAPKAWLGATDRAAAMRPAVFENGTTFLCSAAYGYALEVEGANFKPGYIWGGAKVAATAKSGAAP
jgi:hypothetical protein